MGYREMATNVNLVHVEEVDDETAAQIDEQNKKKMAAQEKELGNTAYKKKDLSEAIRRYQRAIEIDNTDMTYYNNLAQVYLDLEEWDQVIEHCDNAIQREDGLTDIVKVAKAMTRKPPR